MLMDGMMMGGDMVGLMLPLMDGIMMVGDMDGNRGLVTPQSAKEVPDVLLERTRSFSCLRRLVHPTLHRPFTILDRCHLGR